MEISKQNAALYAQWLADAGVHDVAAETPKNFYQPTPPIAETIAQKTPKPSARRPRQPAAMVAPQPAATPPDITEAIANATSLAQAAETLDQLKTALSQFDGCELKKTARNLVFADGNPKAEIMLIGEAPGEQEDRQGKPFVGRAGQLLDRILAAADFNRDNVYITNILPWRPPGNRNPSDAERALCRPFLDKHIALVAPKVLIFLGAVAAKELLATSEGITRLRGRWHRATIDGQEYDALPMLHPAYLLRQPAQKAFVWHDMLMVQEKIRGGD